MSIAYWCSHSRPRVQTTKYKAQVSYYASSFIRTYRITHFALDASCKISLTALKACRVVCGEQLSRNDGNYRTESYRCRSVYTTLRPSLIIQMSLKTKYLLTIRSSSAMGSDIFKHLFEIRNCEHKRGVFLAHAERKKLGISNV